jgi:hypothetical protein
MTLPVFLHVGTPERGRIWGQHLAAAIPGMETRQWPDIGDPAEIGYVGAWTLPQGLLDGLPNLRFLLSVGAGVDQLDLSVVPEGLPVLRMVDPALAEGMTEYVTAGFCPCTATCTITAQPHKRANGRIALRCARRTAVWAFWAWGCWVSRPWRRWRPSASACRAGPVRAMICPVWTALPGRRSWALSCAISTFWSACCR